jgi:ankyrin repeat protein
MVEALAAGGADVNARDAEGCSALVKAAERDDMEAVRMLAKIGADVNSGNDEGDTALLVTGSAEIIRMLVLEYGADVDLRNTDGETPLWRSVNAQHMPTVQALAACGADANLAPDDERPPLCIAAFRGDTDMVRVLVECGADVDIRGADNETPLWIAAYEGHTATVRALVLDHGASVRTYDDNGQTAVGAAAYMGHAETVWTLVRECGADSEGLDEVRDREVAFAMAMHRRLGRNSVARNMNLENVLRLILSRQWTSPLALANVSEYATVGTVNLLEWLEPLEHAAPVHRERNDAVRSLEFECAVCMDVQENPLALIPCGHRVCRDCWTGIVEVADSSAEPALCPFCRESVYHAASQDSFHPAKPLYSRFCVQLPTAPVQSSG